VPVYVPATCAAPTVNAPFKSKLSEPLGSFLEPPPANS
jgi:hypothetical protein